MVFRQLGIGAKDDISARPFQTFSGRDLTLAEVVRASAAFPSIPPRRIHFPSDSNNPVVAESTHVGYLADGGVWNNLATQALREMRLSGLHATEDRRDGILRPYSMIPNMPLLVVNASAPLRRARAGWFAVPLLSLPYSIFRTSQILATNTVVPRVERMRSNYRFYIRRGIRPGPVDPVDLVADLAPVTRLQLDYFEGTWSEDLIRQSDPAVESWERSVANTVKYCLAHPEEGVIPLTYFVDPPEGTYPVPGLANMEEWDSLRWSDVWQRLLADEGAGELYVTTGDSLSVQIVPPPNAEAPTTLGRISPESARRLVARGYLNSYWLSLFLAPTGNETSEALANLSDRLDRIVPGSLRGGARRQQ